MRPTNLFRCVNNTRERFGGAKHAQALTFEAATRKPMLRPALACECAAPIYEEVLSCLSNGPSVVPLPVGGGSGPAAGLA